MSVTYYDIYSILPEIYLLFCINILLMYGVFFSTSILRGFPVLSLNMSGLVLQVSCLSLIILLISPNFSILSWNYLLTNNFFAFYVKIMLLLGFIIWLLLAYPYVLHEKLNSFEYWILSLLALVGMLFIIQSNDLLSMYVSIEFQSLVFYILATFKRNSEFSTEAGLKYFILGAFSSALLLFGSSLLYSLTGLTNFVDFMKFSSGLIVEKTLVTNGMGLGLIFIVTALLFKLGAAPFHTWMPDIYEGSPTSVTAFFAILPKLAIFSLMLRICFFTFHDFVYFWHNLIVYCAYFSILFGTLGAFSQTKLKRFIAYSSINHVGFFLLSLVTGELEGIFGIIFYAMVYMLMTFSIFLSIISLRYYSYPNHFQSRYLKDLTNLSDINPLLSFSLAVVLFSLAGIPPLLGFFAKIFVLLPAVQGGMYKLTIFAVLMNCIACFYYLRLIKFMYFDKLTIWPVIHPISKTNSFLLGSFVILLSLLFLDLEFILLLFTRMSISFLG